jgi:hypothetical protein
MQLGPVQWPPPPPPPPPLLVVHVIAVDAYVNALHTLATEFTAQTS